GVLLAAVLGLAGCGDNHGTAPDAGRDATQIDAAVDAPVDLVRRISVAHEDVLAAAPPQAPSTLGFASAAQPYGTGASSWQFRKPSTGHAAEKFELYLPLIDDGSTLPAPLAELIAYLGPVTIADIASIEVHTRRNTASSPDFSVVLYTAPHGTGDNDASWYARRLHADPLWAGSPDVPAGTWTERSTATGSNQLRFWDFRHANTNLGVQPSDNVFTLADMQAGPVTPAGTTLPARDYRGEQIAYLTVMTYSNETQFDASIDGIEIHLTNGKGAVLDLEGDSKLFRAAVSLEQMRARHATGNSYGVASTATATSPQTGARSWNYVKNAGSPAAEKFELYLPFAAPAGATVDPLWDAVRAHLGTFTIADIASIQLHSRKSTQTAQDFTALIYTLPDGTDDDASWFGRRLHASLDAAGSLDAPPATWNAFSTAAGTNQLRFWDFRHANPNLGVVPSDNLSTLAELQAGPVVPTGTNLPARDYRGETVQYLTLSTYSDYPVFDGSLDGIEIALTNGQRLLLDLEQ
ncbi:MAG: hypothetical protein ACTHU0_24840, partial [Kofleriaceae bacterium]